LWSKSLIYKKKSANNFNCEDKNYIDNYYIILYVVLYIYIVVTVLKPDPARRVDPESDWPETKTGLGLRKNKKSQNPGWPGDPVKNPVATHWFFFLLKQHRFDFKKIRMNSSDPVKTRNPGLGPGRPPVRV
jgi:hypothetical protein